MKTMVRALFVLIILALVVPAAGAIEVKGNRVLIPMIARVPGAQGSVWRTDVFISNWKDEPQTLTLAFYYNGITGVAYHTRTLPPFTCVSLPDAVKNVFGMEEASGQLEITTSAAREFEARARIYNIGSAAGEFGQSVQGSGFNYLRYHAYAYGLDGSSGNRLNVGIANPNDTEMRVNIRLRLGSGEELLYVERMVPARTTLQINDVLGVYGLARQADIVMMLTDFSVNDSRFYGYVSQVRNDSNDAIFVFGTSPY